MLENNATAALEHDRQKSQKTFTDKHGAVLAQKMYYLCNVADDEHLPEVH